MEKIFGEEFPDCLKLLLKKAGYDRLISLSMIDDLRVAEIETHLQKTRDTWINEITCCNNEYYERISVFEFLPGHRTTILSIRDKIQQMGGVKGFIRGGMARVATADLQLDLSKKERSDEEIVQNLVSNMMKYAEKNVFHSMAK